MKKKLILSMFIIHNVLHSSYHVTFPTSQKPFFQSWDTAQNGAYDQNIVADTKSWSSPQFPILRNPSKIWGKHKAPFPTNRWFTTLTIPSDISYSNATTPPAPSHPFSVITFPYTIDVTAKSVHINLPEKQYIAIQGDTSTAYSCKDATCDSTPLNVGHMPTPPGGSKPNYPFTSSLISIAPYTVELAWQETLSSPVIVSPVKNNPLAVTVQIGSSDKNVTIPLVRGMPFVTAEYQNSTPVFNAIGQAILEITTYQSGSQKPLHSKQGNVAGSLTGNIFIIQLNSGKTWHMFTSEPITLSWTGKNTVFSKDQTMQQLTASKSFNGVVQLINYDIPLINPPALPLPGNPAANSGWQIPAQYSSYSAYIVGQYIPAFKVWYKSAYGDEASDDTIADIKNIFNASSKSSSAILYNNFVNQDVKGTYKYISQQWIQQQKETVFPKIIKTIKLLEGYSGTYPTGGSVKLSGDAQNPTVSITWQTVSTHAAKKTNDLIMMCLPHHQQLLQNPSYEKNITYDSARGMLRAVKGSSWTLRYENPNISWYCQSDAKLKNQATVTFLNKLIAADLDDDVNATTPSPYAGSYGFGKEIARLARLAIIADQIDSTQALKQCVQLMKKAVLPWIDRTNLNNPKAETPLPNKYNRLFYDPQWGGICTENGMLDHTLDYGMGWYNDHHFHFGYFIYSAAIYIHLSSKLKLPDTDNFISKKLIPFTVDLIRDIANPVADDYFPDFRMMDWYLGHSLAAGIFPFGNGKNQESTSEAVNAWYGMYLFGLATNNATIQNLGNTLLASEINAAQTYWQMTADSEIYPSLFNKLACVGVLWENKADYATFFGANVEYINLIHFLPFTPATEILIPQAWNSYQYELLKTSLNPDRKNPDGTPNPIQASWRSFVRMSQAISQTNEAFEQTVADYDAKKLTPFDEGNSATNTFYWMFTRGKIASEKLPTLISPTPSAVTTVVPTEKLPSEPTEKLTPVPTKKHTITPVSTVTPTPILAQTLTPAQTSQQVFEIVEVVQDLVRQETEQKAERLSKVLDVIDMLRQF
ncbi:MAG: glycosyl hydrolase [Candidatus Babeliales bacterium]